MDAAIILVGAHACGYVWREKLLETPCMTLAQLMKIEGIKGPQYYGDDHPHLYGAKHY